MFTNFIKVTIRNLYREKMYAIINISGLSLAIACCLILGLWLRCELIYDRHNIQYRQIYRVVNESVGDHNFNEGPSAVTSPSLGPMLADEYPEIRSFVRVRIPEKESLICHGDDTFYWDSIFFADDNIFDVFTHDIIYGDPKTALVEPASIAVSKSFADKYFGDANPIGETVSDEERSYKITLVFADLPENTHLRYDALFAFSSLEDPQKKSEQDLWSWNVHTFLLMPEGYNALDFADISDAFFARHMSEKGNIFNDTWRCWLQPLANIHFNSDVGFDQPTTNKFYFYGFAAVGVFILLVACINYMNLATARASKRVKEVGMRKILGAGRTCLIFQFLGESIFFSLIALFFGLVLVEVALNLTPINELLNKPLALNFRHGPGLLVWMLTFSLIVGLMSGIYPAIYLSSMLPLPALVTGIRAGKGNIRFRQLLVMIQFIITAIVIACTLIMAMQMRYVSGKPLGLEKTNRLFITLRDADLIEKIPIIKKELSKNSNILGISACSTMIGQPTPKSLMLKDNQDLFGGSGLNRIWIDDDFVNLMGLELVEGRDFSKKLLTDLGGTCLVNETFVKSMGNKLGWEKPLGMPLPWGKIIGVVKDFHFASLHSPIEPFVLMSSSAPKVDNTPGEKESNSKSFLILHISGKNTSNTLCFLENKLSEFDRKHPFEFEFLDDAIDRLYLSEHHLMKLTGIFAGVCIFISCLGLFGLAAFTTEQRTKEIGIRKVMGASTWRIIRMLFRNTLFLVLGGAVIASLVAYYAMDEWLTGFAYRIGINPMVFLLSSIIAAGVAFITVSMQSYKTASANPVEALRYE
jgi:putative ABC transport system permease protein